MRIIDADAQVIADLKDEGRVVEERTYASFSLATIRHPTLGKLVVVQAPNGDGALVATEE
jgi:hypothetical protein